MEDHKCCEVCGRPYSELHHVVYRSQGKYMEHIPINFKYLCHKHHRGNESPHRCKNIDLQYKKSMQDKLKTMFSKDYYTLDEIKEILGVSTKIAERIVKTLPLNKEGYENNKLIFRMMGDRFYD